MNKKFFLLTGLLLFLITALLPAFGSKEKVIQVTGTVRLVGSANFPEIVITGTEAEWYISREEAALLNDLQHRTVTVEGIETILELKFANGLPAGKRRELRKIKIISVL